MKEIPNPFSDVGVKCENCAFFQNYECRRQAPLAVMQIAFPGTTPYTNQGDYTYPKTYGTDWCGEFQKRAGLP